VAGDQRVNPLGREVSPGMSEKHTAACGLGLIVAAKARASVSATKGRDKNDMGLPSAVYRACYFARNGPDSDFFNAFGATSGNKEAKNFCESLAGRRVNSTSIRVPGPCGVS
jgi:hypothetical protein